MLDFYWNLAGEYMPLPRVTEQICDTMMRDITEILMKGEDYDTEMRKILREENPRLDTFLGFLARRGGREEGEAFMRGALMTYRLLRQQAEVDDLERDIGPKI